MVCCDRRLDRTAFHTKESWQSHSLIIHRCAVSASWIIPGALIALSGHAGTLWCYTVLGDNWRIGINRKEKTALITNGPYKFVRHPIYLFQIMILIGMVFLLPTPLLVHYTPYPYSLRCHEGTG